MLRTCDNVSSSKADDLLVWKVPKKRNAQDYIEAKVVAASLFEELAVMVGNVRHQYVLRRGKGLKNQLAKRCTGWPQSHAPMLIFIFINIIL